MDIRNLLLGLLWLALAPLAGESAPPPGAWKPPAEVPANRPPQLDTAHRLGERLHERWLPEVEWSLQRSKQLAARMLCQLGPIGLALVDCPALAASAAPENTATLPRPAGSSGSPPLPDFRDIRRRSIEERMHSI